MRRALRGTGDVMDSISPTSYASRADGVRPMPFNAPHSVLRSQLAR
jgi:hypothetical protein